MDRIMPKAVSAQKFIGPKEAAEVLGCGYETVLRYVADGKLSATRPLGLGPGKPILLDEGEVFRFRDALRIVTGRG